METLILLIVEFIVWTVLYHTAKFALPFLTFKKVQSKPYEKMTFLDLPWVEKRDGVFYVGFDLSIIIGLVIWIFAVLAIIAIL